MAAWRRLGEENYNFLFETNKKKRVNIHCFFVLFSRNLPLFASIMPDNKIKNTFSSAQCSPLDRVDYGHLLWTTLAEFPGITLTLVAVERLGR